MVRAYAKMRAHNGGRPCRRPVEVVALAAARWEVRDAGEIALHHVHPDPPGVVRV